MTEQRSDPATARAGVCLVCGAGDAMVEVQHGVLCKRCADAAIWAWDREPHPPGAYLFNASVAEFQRLAAPSADFPL